jgi:hypothetical protein
LKGVVRERSSRGGAPHYTVASAKAKRGGAPHYTVASAKTKSRGCSFAKAKAYNVLLDFEAGTSEDFPPKIKMSFRKGAIGIEVDKWEITLEQFLAME